ncbi:MAG: ACT domain-containing protein [Acidimicrobiales bacterium]|nr:ACT domain-containing protein [Acidimicrobiales bacterium]
MSRLAVTAIGADRPGIVAAVTRVLVDHACNLEDTSMTILRGHFAMMLVVAAPQGVTSTSLEAALAPVADDLGLVVVVRALGDPAGTPAEAAGWRVSVHGADRPGIVHRVAAVCAGHGANVVDLSTRVVGPDDRPVYVLLLDLALPPGLAVDRLRADLEAAAAELDVDCVLRPVDPDIF